MLLSKREEQLMKAFLQVGKLSLKEMSDILQVSSRTVYRTLADLTESLSKEDIQLVRDGKKYYLSGNLSLLMDYQGEQTYSSSQRLTLMAYHLLITDSLVTNEAFQKQFWVSNVTVIQDIARIEESLQLFDLTLVRQRGYQIEGITSQKRRFLAVLLTNAISVQAFWTEEYGEFVVLDRDHVRLVRKAFESHQQILGELDANIRQFLMILLALADNQGELPQQVNVSKIALDFSQKVFTNLSKESKQFYSLQEIIYFASVLDEIVIKRQEVPLFSESFDTRFYYSVSQLVDSVSRLTKIAFVKDKVLFPLLFHHIRLSLAVPVLFPERSMTHVAYLATQKNPFLHRVVSLVMQDLFPTYIQNDYEYDLVTLHFASSLRRSPDIYPIRLLLLTDERPLATSVLVSRIKSVAPFVEWIDVQSVSRLAALDRKQYDYCLTTSPLAQVEMDVISIFPSTKELLTLQETLQSIQENRPVEVRKELVIPKSYDLQAYLRASSHLLSHFSLSDLDNARTFEETVWQIVESLSFVEDKTYLAQKLLERFKRSPFAIPQTNLALIHTQSHSITQSQFCIINLTQPVTALSMANQPETVHRILVMLTKQNEQVEMKELMTAISQSIIENKLYTEIYRTGNQEIIYQLLNSIFNDSIKQWEN